MERKENLFLCIFFILLCLIFVSSAQAGYKVIPPDINGTGVFWIIVIAVLLFLYIVYCYIVVRLVLPFIVFIAALFLAFSDWLGTRVKKWAGG